MVNLGKYTVVPWHPSWFPIRHRATSDTFDLCRGIQRCAGREDGVGETKIEGSRVDVQVMFRVEFLILDVSLHPAMGPPNLHF